tara:strand:- start:2700 stop:3158 length:459 start_codon:yes stop_codon:yes gene_type:complete
MSTEYNLCNVCSANVIGSPFDLLAHQSVPTDEPFPKGLVFGSRDANGTYYVVSYSPFLDRNPTMRVTENFDSPYEHAHMVHFHPFEVSDGGLIQRAGFVRNSKKLRERFSAGELLFLDEQSIAEFKGLLPSSEELFRLYESFELPSFTYCMN